MSSSKLFNRVGRFSVVPITLLWQAPVIGANAILLWAYLYSVEDSETGVAFPSYNTISTKTGLDRNAISKAIRGLEKIGAIHRKKRFSASTIYSLISPILSSSMENHTTGSPSSMENHTTDSMENHTLTREGTSTNKYKTQKPSASRNGHTNGRVPKNLPDLTKGTLPMDPEERKAAVQRMRRLDAVITRLEQMTLLKSGDSVKARQQFQRAAEKLLDGKRATMAQTEVFMRWFAEDWRGKGGKHPTLSQVVELWDLAMGESGGAGSNGAKGYVFPELIP